MNLGKRAILIVTDDAAESGAMAQSFRKAHVPNPLKFVADGDGAVTYLQNGKPSDHHTQALPLLMLLDLALPRRAGFKLLAWVRKQYWMEDLVILAIAGPKAIVQTRQARSLGANCCLRKPIDFEKLTPIVKNLNAQLADKIPNKTRPRSIR